MRLLSQRRLGATRIPTLAVTVVSMHFRLHRTSSRRLTGFIALVVALLLALPLAANASRTTARPNTKCHTLHQTATYRGKVLRCESTARGKKVWRVKRQPRATTTRTVSNFTDQPITEAFSIESANEPAPSSGDTDMSTRTSETSTYPVLPDPDNGGSPDVVVVDPEETERPNPALPVRVPGFSLDTLTETTASFSFAPLEGVTNYQVYVRYADSFTLKGAVATNPVVNFTELTPDWGYTACVYYHRDSLGSEKSCINFRTLGSRPVEPLPANGPAEVAASATETTITVNWSRVVGASWYSICHLREDSMQCGGYTELSETSAIFQDGSINPGWDYTIIVQAVFADGTRSSESRTTVRSLGTRPTPNPRISGVSNFRVVAVTPTTATVAWDYSDSSNINVWSVNARHLTSHTSIGVDPSAREFTITNLSPGLGYEITIQGRNDTQETDVVSTSVLMPRG